MSKLVLSPLNHTWILDLDGTLVKHNGYLIDGYDSLLHGVRDFLESIPKNDMIIILTSRDEKYKELTEGFLLKNNIRFNSIIYGVPYGERILFNDKKPSGLITGISINTDRDKWKKIKVEINSDL